MILAESPRICHPCGLTLWPRIAPDYRMSPCSGSGLLDILASWFMNQHDIVRLRSIFCYLLEGELSSMLKRWGRSSSCLLTSLVSRGNWGHWGHCGHCGQSANHCGQSSVFEPWRFTHISHRARVMRLMRLSIILHTLYIRLWTVDFKQLCWRHFTARLAVKLRHSMSNSTQPSNKLHDCRN